MEAEADVVPDAAQPHGGQRARHHLQRARFGRAVVAAQQKQEPVWGGELGCGLETAVPAVEAEGDVVIGAVQQADAGCLGRRELEGLAEGVRHPGRGGVDRVRFLNPDGLDPLAEFDQPGASEPAAFGQVGGREEGLFVRRHENSQRPAAAAVQQMAGGHVDGVDVRALLAVDLDAHKRVV